MANTLREEVELRSKIIDAQNKKISAEIEIVTLLIEKGNKAEAKALIALAREDISVLVDQKWYENLLSILKTLSESLE